LLLIRKITNAEIKLQTQRHHRETGFGFVSSNEENIVKPKPVLVKFCNRTSP